MTELTLCKQLDELEDKMPPLVANYMRVNRAIVTRTGQEMSRLGNLAVDSAGAILNAAGTSMRTVTGTARYAGERAASVAATGARQTVGQAKAQSKRTVDNTSEELKDLAEDINPSDEAPASTDLESLTKTELYDRAQELDIEGRSSMTKAELIAALRAN